MPFAIISPKELGVKRRFSLNKQRNVEPSVHVDTDALCQSHRLGFFIQLYQLVSLYPYCGNNFPTTTKTAKAVLFSYVHYLGS